MREHVLLSIAKLTLLVVVALLLLFTFIAHNETQSKVIATAERVDELQDLVAESSRTLRDLGSAVKSIDELRAEVGELSARLEGGAAVATAGSGGARSPEATGARKGPRIPGYVVLFSDEPPRPRPPDDEIDFEAELRTGLLTEPKALNLYTSGRDAQLATDLGYYIYGHLGERMDSDKNRFKPGLAERMEASPDYTEFHIWLRPGVYWHRPAFDLTDPKYAWMKGEREVTTEDLLFSLDMILDERADTGQIRPSFRNVESYHAVDRYHAVIRWKKREYMALAAIMDELQPIPKWIYGAEEDGTPIEKASQGPRFADHWANKSMCGYGMYRFKEYAKGEYIILERNERYWGRRPAYKTIRYKLHHRQDEERYNLFMRFDENGERMQYAYPIAATRLRRDILENDGTSELLKQLREKKLFIYGYQRMMFAYTGWQCKSKFFDDSRVRRAMTLAANREAWRTQILLGEAIFPTGPAFVLAPEYDRSVQPWPYDLDAAAKLLDEAGWRDDDQNGVREKTIGGVKTEFRFKVMSQADSGPELDAMRIDWEQSLRRIGVIMEFDPLDWAQFLSKADKREFDAIGGAWRLGNEFDPSLTYHSRLIDIPGSHNYGQWSNPRADEIIDALEGEFDLAKRIRLYHEFHRIFHEEQPYTMQWSWKNSVAVDSRVGGLEQPRAFLPQIGLNNVYKVKRGIAKYDDDRYEVPKR